MRKAVVAIPAVLLFYVFSFWPFPATSAQTPSGVGVVEEPVVQYLEKLLEPAIEGRLNGETAARAFYNARLSDQTRTQVGEEEFAIFWTLLAKRHSAVLLPPIFRATVHAPLESETPDQALVPVTANISGLALSGAVFGVPVHVLIGCSPVLSTVVSPLGECSRAARSPTVDLAGNFNPVYRVNREGGVWKLVLHDGLVEEMKQGTAMVSVRRYTPEVEAGEAGLTIRVVEVILRRDLAVLRVNIANNRDEALRLVNPLSLASLIDEGGATYGTKLLRSEIPETVPARSAVRAVVAFEPVPLLSRRLVLVLSDIVVGNESRALRVNIDLVRLPFASVKPELVPGQPVLVHLLVLLRRVVMTDEQIATVYRTHLAQETKAQVSESQFIRYHQAEAADAWLCRFDFPYEFSIGPPVYDPTRQQALIKVETRRPGASPATTMVETFSYRVLRESGLWKVALPPDMARHLREWRPVSSKQSSVSPMLSMDAFSVGVRSVELDVHRTKLEVTISNQSREQFALDKVLADATLTDRWGRSYARSSSRGARPPANQTLLPQSGVTLDLEFRPLPVESRRFILSVTDPTLAPFLWIKPKINVRVDLGCP